MQNISILDNVVLTFGSNLAARFQVRFRPQFLQGCERVHEGLNEGLFEICVDHTSCLRCFGSVSDGPLPYFIGADREKTAQIKNLAHRNDDLGKSGISADVLALLQSLGLGLKLSQAILKGHRDGDDRVARGVLLAPLGDLGKVLVLLPDVILLRKIDQVDHGLGAEQEERVDDLDLSALSASVIPCK